MSEQILRQGLNKVKVTGLAQESTLEIKELNDNNTGLPYKCISGDVTIQVNEDESHTLSYYAKELTKNGSENKQYKALLTAMKEMVTLADIAQGLVEGEPSKLNCQGELTLNEYKGQDGEVKSFPKIRGNFAPSRHSVKDGEFVPKATFDIEGIVKNTRAEMVKEEETGRVIIDLIVPIFNGNVIPLQFVSGDTINQQGCEYLLENFTRLSSVNIYGNIVNKAKKVERVVESAFGENKTETSYEYVREFAVRGGTLYEEGIHDKNIFDTTLLKEALANRERHLASIKERENKPKQQDKPAGFGNGASTPISSKPATKAPAPEGLDDLFND